MSGDPLEQAKRRRRRAGESWATVPTRFEVARSDGLRGWRFFVVELVIVFLGVFGAAAADDWRDRRHERAQTALLTANVVKTLDGLIRHDRTVRAAYQQKLDRFDAAIARGERSAIPFLFRRGARTVPTVGWDMLLAAGGASRLPPDRMYDLGMYFATVEGLSTQTSAYMSFVEVHVLPHKDDPAHFYLPGENRLKPEYRENVERLREILGLEATLARRAVRLRQSLVAG